MGASTGKVSFLQIGMVMMLMCGLSNHVIINPMLLQAAGRDAWISVILGGVLFLPWYALLHIFMRRSGAQKLQPWLASKTTPLISWIIVTPFLLQLYTIGGTTVFHTTTWAVTNYLPETPKLSLVLVLCAVAWYFARSGLRMIAISSGMLLPIVIVLGYFVASANMPEKDFRYLQPILEKGWLPVFHGMLYAWGGYMELAMILTVQHRIKSQPKVWKLLLLAAIIVYITLGPVIGGITEFGYEEAAKQMTSPYEQWRLVKLGQNIEHVDFLSVFQWLSGAVVRVGFAMFLIGDMLPFKQEAARKRLVLYLVLSYLVLSMLPIEAYTAYIWMYSIYFPISLVTGFVTVMVCLAISLFAKSKKKEAAV
ncbi:endospore germination permease [Paenibacillus puerhi]|uniref:endospore germination permease n=1 Tax=Paenibacillus puerhi TaxID=2692622 RepID=UPI001F2345DF|nr:endospore germination permease [Paenibacillus puerhi]